jgi:hypothetical protein
MEAVDQVAITELGVTILSSCEPVLQVPLPFGITDELEANWFFYMLRDL